MNQSLSGAVIGYGFISGKGHIPAYLMRQDVRIQAVVDICPARREEAKKALPWVQIFESAEALFDAVSMGTLKLDFVDISTPPCDHAKIATQALNLGLHVLCEKPLTCTIQQAHALIASAKKNQRVLFPVHNYKHAPVVKAIRDVIDSGRIGEVRSVTLSTYRNTHAKGVTEWNTHWRRDFKFSGGGIAMDHGSHTFYLTFDWLKSYPVAVTAKMVNQEPEKYDTEDNYSAVLTFPEGKLAHVHLTWTAGVRKVIYTLQGTKGAIRVEDDEIEIAVQRKTDGPDVAQGAISWDFERRSISSDWMDASHVSWFNSLFDQFFFAIQNQDYVGKEIQESVKCIEIIETSYRSAREKSIELGL
jgi:predicted dehydrogenase